MAISSDNHRPQKKTTESNRWSSSSNGGGKEIRTPDTQTASLVLYQLSYTPTAQSEWK
jgi:hypothetical protein